MELYLHNSDLYIHTRRNRMPQFHPPDFYKPGPHPTLSLGECFYGLGQRQKPINIHGDQQPKNNDLYLDPHIYISQTRTVMTNDLSSTRCVRVALFQSSTDPGEAGLRSILLMPTKAKATSLEYALKNGGSPKAPWTLPAVCVFAKTEVGQTVYARGTGFLDLPSPLNGPC